MTPTANTKLPSDQWEPEAVARAREYISQHHAEAIQLAEVARVANMSVNYFSERFKEVTKLRFVEYVARTRVEKACDLLQNPHVRISEVAFKVGFQSLSQFNRAFKKIVGKSPSNYRAELATAA